MHILPEMSDHDIPMADSDINPGYNKKQLRKIYDLQTADWEQFEKETKNSRHQFCEQHNDRYVDQTWKISKNTLYP